METLTGRLVYYDGQAVLEYEMTCPCYQPYRSFVSLAEDSYDAFVACPNCLRLFRIQYNPPQLELI